MCIFIKKTRGSPEPESFTYSFIHCNSCYIKTTDVGGDVDQSHAAKNLNILVIAKIKSPRNCFEAEKRET
jgi:hypothetical protein